METDSTRLHPLSSPQGGESLLLSLTIEQFEGGGLNLQKPYELRAADPELLGRIAVVPIGGGQAVQALRQKAGKVVVRRIDRQLPSPGPAAPQVGRLLRSGRIRWAPDRQRKTYTQPQQRNGEVLGLATPLASFGNDTGRAVGELDRRFDLVAVLAAGAGPPQATDLAVVFQVDW